MQKWLRNFDKNGNFIYIDLNENFVLTKSDKGIQRENIKNTITHSLIRDDTFAFVNQNNEYKHLKSLSNNYKEIDKGKVIDDFEDKRVLSTYEAAKKNGNVINVGWNALYDVRKVLYSDRQPGFYSTETDKEITTGFMYDHETNKFNKMDLKDIDIKQTQNILNENGNYFNIAYGTHKGKNVAVAIVPEKVTDINGLLNVPKPFRNNEIQNYDIAEVDNFVAYHTHDVLLRNKENGNLIEYDDSNEEYRELKDTNNIGKMEDASIFIFEPSSKKSYRNISLQYVTKTGSVGFYYETKHNASINKGNIYVIGEQPTTHDKTPSLVQKYLYSSDKLDNIILDKNRVGC